MYDERVANARKISAMEQPMASSSSEGAIRGMMASPHPTEGKCLNEECGGPITDIWAEFLEIAADKAAVSLGKADFTCPYCNFPLRFDPQTNRIVPAQGGEPLRYHHGAAIKRAAYENSSIFGLMRDKRMLNAGKPAFLNYVFKDRQAPLNEVEGETVYSQKETNP
jgi:hypothetical protein